ncbi:MAG TPA: cytochrome c [Flavobacterium sp.]|jgi:nitric oxide reductase subunit C|nr:cytochrome c [Flavobacterium sp.]HRZ73583.1 cytochrome c [Flavobacterium sp.]
MPLIKVSPLKIFITLSVLFLIYSFTIYLKPLREKDHQKIAYQKQSASGKDVWQKHNCHTCHQLYGLGGYLGPDLTNVTAKPGYSDVFLKAIISNGISQMPAFDLTNREMEDLLVFLKAMNETGTANPRHYSTQINGTFTLDNLE